MENKTVTIEQLKTYIADEVKEAQSPLAEEFAKLSKSMSDERKSRVQSAEEKSNNAIRVAMAMVEAQIKTGNGSTLEGGNVVSDAFATIEKRYGVTDPVFVEEVKDLMATGNGGNLVDETWSTSFIERLIEPTIINKLGVTFMNSSTGNLYIPKVIEGLAAGYIGEGQTIDTSTLLFGHIRLSVKKLMALTPISNDLIKTAAINVQSLVQSELSTTMVAAMDQAFLYGVGGQWEPLGIANIEGITKMPGNPQAARDIGYKMLKELGERNHSTDDATFIMGWDTFLKLQLEGGDNGNLYNLAELNAGKFAGQPYIVTNRVKKDGNNQDFFLVKPNDINAIQLGGIELHASKEASIHTKEGMLSAYGQDFTLVRAIAHHDFGLAYKSSVVYASVDATPKA